MDIITTPAAVYSPPSTAILHNTTASLTDRSPTAPVHLVQYDQTVPVIAVSLTENGSQYTVPSGAAVNVRMDKPDGKHVYDPALGISEDGKIVYIGVTAQMTAAWGRSNPIVEIVIDDGIVGTAAFPVIIDQNPVPDSAYESTDEYLTLYEILQQAQNAAQIVQQNAQNLQNLTDNLEAVQNAAANAQAAAASAQAAQQAAQEALGFRTFFSAIPPDTNGNLDPSRPMTTPAAASVTIESKGDRIQRVQVSGFTQQAGTGDPSPTNVRVISTAGIRMVEIKVDGSQSLQWLRSGQSSWTNCAVAYLTLDYNIVSAFCDKYTPFNAQAPLLSNIGVAFVSGQPYIYASVPTATTGLTTSSSAEQTVQAFNQYFAENPIFVWAVPADESQATGLYIPVQAQGHEYRCQCLELTAPLCDGDKVESCVPSGCDKRIVLDGSEDEGWILNSQMKRFDLNLNPEDFPLPESSTSPQYSNFLDLDINSLVIDGTGRGFCVLYVAVSGKTSVLIGTDFAGSVSELRSKLSENPLVIVYRSTAYTDQNDIPVQLETHANAYSIYNGAEPGWTSLNITTEWVQIGIQAGAQYTSNDAVPDVVSDIFTAKSINDVYSTKSSGVSIDSNGRIRISFASSDFPSVNSLETALEYLSDNAASFVYPLTSPAVYARDPVTLVAVPYTAADSDQIAGTYTISSQDGTTVTVSLKAMQDGGDAATLGGLTLDDIKQLISDAVSAAVQMAQA